MSLSWDGATKRSPLSYRQRSMILLCLARLSTDGSESAKMAIYPVMTIRVLVDRCQYWDQSCRSPLIGIHLQAPELYQTEHELQLRLMTDKLGIKLQTLKEVDILSNEFRVKPIASNQIQIFGINSSLQKLRNLRGEDSEKYRRVRVR
jgi:hypothetical protein